MGGLPLLSCVLPPEPAQKGLDLLEDISTIIGKFHPAVSIFFLSLSLFVCFWAELSASYISTEELLLKTRSIAGETNSSGKCMTDCKYI